MATEKQFKLGIVGTGVMGANHAKIAGNLTVAELTGIYDVDEQRAKEIAELYETNSYNDLDKLCNDCDGIIIAAPTFLHAEIGSRILNNNKHLLIEKPLALNEDDARMLIDLADKNDLTLAVGHIEQYNATFMTLREIIKGDEIFDGKFERLAMQAGRDKSATIVFDLMIHDLELALSLGGKLKNITAAGHKMKHDFIDHATAVLIFENGITFSLTASAVSQMRTRTVTLFGKKHTYIADLGNFTITVHTKDGEAKIINVDRSDALTKEHEDFIDSAKNNTKPAANNLNALNAIVCAKKIEEIINGNGVN